MHDDDETIVSGRHLTATLVVERGGEVGRTYTLSGESVVLGRGADVEVRLPDSECSRRHAVVTRRDRHLSVRDLGSTNGTFVNDQRVRETCELRDGDRVRVGNTTLRVQVDGAAAVVETSRSAGAARPAAPGDVPSRRVLSTAADTNQRLGHENLGFLSETHGIVPRVPPRLELPAAYRAWDALVERMPELWRTMALRKSLESLPVLSAAESELPEAYLLRASAILGHFAHAYFRIEPEPAPNLSLPASIERPWQEISTRLGRPAPHLSYIDLIVYNWQLVDPESVDPMRAENMRLLVPTVDNDAERYLYLPQVEMLARSTPIINAVVRAQEAAHRDDFNALQQELVCITDALQRVANRSFMKINPNVHSDTPVESVTFAKTVAPFAVPIKQGVVGAGGSAAPIFHVLDAFFGRRDYETRLGKEMLHIREWFPKHWRDFIDAIGKISVLDCVARSRSTALQGTFMDALHAYIGESGYLSRHRLKAYGYLDIGFKVGRNQTIGGFKGLFKDRTWDLAAFELTSAHAERQGQYPQASHHVEVRAVRDVGTEGRNWIRQIVLDVDGTGIRWHPGDRCGILPENSAALVAKTLEALRARGNEPVRLNARWREAITLRHGYEASTTLPLGTLLTFGRIRPLDRDTAKALHAVSINETLRRIVEARMEDQWELWDLLDMLAEAGFDPKRLWKAHPGEEEHICRIVQPEQFRMYSVSSAMTQDTADGPDELHLTVGRLAYETAATGLSRKADRLGTASNYLGDTSAVAVERMGHVALRTVQPPRFRLPEDNRTPIVMFAGGTGISPFRSFIQARARAADPGETWLFLGTRTQSDFFHRDELAPFVSQGWLHVRVAFSRDAAQAKFVSGEDGGRFEFEPGHPRHIGEEMLQQENASALWDLLRSRQAGGRGARLYVCGRTRFASSVMDAIKAIIRRFGEGPVDEREAAAQRVLWRLAGEGRLMLEIFTTYTGSQAEQQRLFDASDVARHNNPQDGYWMIVDGRVYDVTEFAELHPGGRKIITGYAGMDATTAWQAVGHHENSEVSAMLGMYEIGAIRRLDFGMRWGVAVGPQGLQFVSLASAFRSWVRLLFNTVEMQNALDNDYTIRTLALTRGEQAADASAYKTQLLIDVHQRFMLNYLSGALGEQLHSLWAATAGLCDPADDARWSQRTVHELQQTTEAQVVERLGDELARRLSSLVDGGAAADVPSRLAAHCELLERENRRFLNELKLLICNGVRVFEEYERDAVTRGGRQLLDVAEALPGVLRSYYARVSADLQAIERPPAPTH